MHGAQHFKKKMCCVSLTFPEPQWDTLMWDENLFFRTSINFAVGRGAARWRKQKHAKKMPIAQKFLQHLLEVNTFLHTVAYAPFCSISCSTGQSFDCHAEDYLLIRELLENPQRNVSKKCFTFSLLEIGLANFLMLFFSSEMSRPFSMKQSDQLAFTRTKQLTLWQPWYSSPNEYLDGKIAADGCNCQMDGILTLEPSITNECSCHASAATSKRIKQHPL